MRWAGHAARMGEGKGAYRILVGKPEGRHHLGDPGIDGRIIINCIFKLWDGGMDWIELAQDRDRWRVLFQVQKHTVLNTAGFLDFLY
jgi:hypothetical protein